MTKRVLITGGTGFIGKHVVSEFEREGWNVTVTSRRGDGRALMPVFDLASPDTSHLPAADILIHLAAVGVSSTSSSTDEDVASANVLGTHALLRHALSCGARRFVYSGSCFEYPPGSRRREETEPRPRSAYAASKAEGWRLVCGYAEKGLLETVTIRPFMVYGPGEPPHRLVASAVQAGLLGRPITISHGTQTRDWVYVKDVARAFFLGATSIAAANQTFNACTGVETSVRDVAEHVGHVLGVPVEVGAVAETGVRFDRLSGDPRKAASLLGWRASYDLERGLETTIAVAQESHASR
ncbi:MAG TPA: NAD(P)-dependent oxidoreductase [Acidimicrobiales bacterium]|nr:NAD(P)-dependent oxidoreductase [Acidimicrobiales bacterium]